ncbi:helix-turn-helix transcriptional regulator [Echinicola pacifica]|uniref:helix-turn-helix transcriptional regulator n=1 Tax=Echinicola pacifica TaxID=346377 RepID=UPI0012F7B944|nr:hypothetical protein [Echinicola pacifica]
MENLILQGSTDLITRYEGKPSAGDIKSLIEKGELHLLNEFTVRFPSFVGRIKTMSSQINAMDLKFCILLRLGFSTKDIARITNSTIRAVQSRKYRIRRRLNVPNQEDINLFMVTIS